MVTIPLFGGLGNQLFQWACGVGLQAKGRRVQYVKDGLYDMNPSNPHHRDKPEYGLEGFLIKPAFGERSGPQIEAYDMPYHDLSNIPDTCVLRGYFQCERYFEHADQVIRSQMIPRVISKELYEHYSDLVRRLSSENSVALHVRRGDYASIPQNVTYHGLMGLDYYRTALQLIAERSGNDLKAWVFSDDPAWCQENMPGTVVSTGDRFLDFMLISSCRHAVIANSTFSWWAAWVGDKQYNGLDFSPKPDRIVVAPKRWFVTPTLDARDVVPSRWVKL